MAGLQFSTASAVLAIALAARLAGQDRLRALDPAIARTRYFFTIVPGAKPFRFQVELDTSSAITGVFIFRPGVSRSFQTLPACSDVPKLQLTEYDDKRDLLKTADLNFDGFGDVQLLQDYSAHLGISIYCIYTWGQEKQRFKYAPEIPSLDPVPHPKQRTITVHHELFGGTWTDETYLWKDSRFKLIERNGHFLYGSTDPHCLRSDYCSRLINGQMVTTAEKQTACDDGKDDVPLVCPGPPR